MSAAPVPDQPLFAYGTLQAAGPVPSNPRRQPDLLDGWRLVRIEQDGQAYWILRRSAQPGVPVAGTCLLVTSHELAIADAYEGDDYARSWVTLRSGRRAWVYVVRERSGEPPHPA